MRWGLLLRRGAFNALQTNRVKPFTPPAAAALLNAQILLHNYPTSRSRSLNRNPCTPASQHLQNHRTLHRHYDCHFVSFSIFILNFHSQVEADEDKDIDYVAQAVADMSVATTGPPSSVSSLPPSPPHQRKSAAAAAAAATTAPVEDVSLSESKPPRIYPATAVRMIYCCTCSGCSLWWVV